MTPLAAEHEIVNLPSVSVLGLLTAPPMAITAPVAPSSVAGIDEKMHEDREESKAEIQLGQKSVVQIGTSKNWQAVSGRNKMVKFGGASRDRTIEEC